MQVFEIPLETPSKKNSRVTCRRTGRSFPNKRYNSWHSQAMAIVKAQSTLKQPISSPVYIRGYFVRGDRRRRDNNNSGASILDMLVDAGVLADDNDEIVVCEKWKKLGVEKGAPMCKVIIEGYNNE